MLIIVLWYLKKWLHRHGHVSEQFRNSDFLIECMLYTGICKRFLLVVAKNFERGQQRILCAPSISKRSFPLFKELTYFINRGGNRAREFLPSFPSPWMLNLRIKSRFPPGLVPPLLSSQGSCYQLRGSWRDRWVSEGLLGKAGPGPATWGQ